MMMGAPEGALPVGYFQLDAFWYDTLPATQAFPNCIREWTGHPTLFPGEERFQLDTEWYDVSLQVCTAPAHATTSPRMQGMCAECKLRVDGVERE